MFTRAYLRASTAEQDATRARQSLADFAEQNGLTIAAWYIENASGAKLHRPELHRLIADAHPGDILLVEAIDRLTRLSAAEWDELSLRLKEKRIRIVALDLETSKRNARNTEGDEFTNRMLDAINAMMIDMLAAIARKDYEQRRQRQAQGIEKAKAQGKYQGRPQDTVKRDKIRALLAEGWSVRKTAAFVGCSTSTVQAVKADM